jgi:hypothetical protein
MPSMIRASVAGLALLLSAAASAAHAQSPLAEHLDPARMTTARDSFVVMMQGRVRGWQLLTMAPDGTGWRVGDAVTIDSLVAQESDIRLDASLHERSLRQQGVMMGRGMEIALDWQDGRVRGRAQTPSSGPTGVLMIDTLVAAGTIDDNAVLPLARAVRWRDSLVIAFPVLSSGKGVVELQQLRVTGSEAVTVPAGTFDTWRVELTAGRSRVVISVMKAAPYRVVQVMNGPAFVTQLAR